MLQECNLPLQLLQSIESIRCEGCILQCNLGFGCVLAEYQDAIGRGGGGGGGVGEESMQRFGLLSGSGGIDHLSRSILDRGDAMLVRTAPSQRATAPQSAGSAAGGAILGGIGRRRCRRRRRRTGSCPLLLDPLGPLELLRIVQRKGTFVHLNSVTPRFLRSRTGLAQVDWHVFFFPAGECSTYTAATTTLSMLHSNSLSVKKVDQKRRSPVCATLSRSLRGECVSPSLAW
mmetsp:Transcript_27901/g.50955  ORF Transcript_27901/g.50955 Transcript_27901/m.50955 type:complete len:231 (+) Transcript_27901:307-999(+)